MATHFQASDTRFQDLDDVVAPAAGATDTGKAWLWNNATSRFEPIDVLTAAEAAAYLPLAGGTMTGQLTMADGIRIHTDEVRARDTSGLTLTENAGVVGVFIQNATGAVAVNTTSPGASTALTVDGRIRSRQVGATRYRADLVVTTTNGNLLAFDDTGAAYIPLYIDGLFTVFRTGAAAEAARFDASGNFIIADSKRIETDEVRARDSGGLTLSENAGAGVTIANSTGQLLVNTAASITGAVAAAQLQVNKTSPGNALFVVDNTSAVNGPSLELMRRRTAFGVLSADDRLGTISFSGADSIDAALGAQIYAEVDGTPGSNDMPGRLVFATSPDGFATPVEALRINSSGNLIVADSKRIETDEMRARDAGGLKLYEDSGIGLHVLDGGSIAVNASASLTGFLGAAQVQIQKDADGAMMVHRTTADANGPTIELLKRRSAFGVVSSGDRAGTILWSAADSVDAAPVASIYAEVDGTPGSNDMPGRLIFATTADGANAVSEAMRIDANRYVTVQTWMGIGGTPDRPLLVTGSSGAGGVSFAVYDSITPTGTSEGPSFQLGFNGGTAKPNLTGDILMRMQMVGQANDFQYVGAEIRSTVTTGGASGRNNHVSNLIFYTKNSGGPATTERLTITGAGNFGFNTGTQFGSGVGVFGVANAATNPSTNPSGGGVLYANAGAGTWRGSSGTVTAFGPAGPHCRRCGFDFWETCYENDTWGAKLKRCGWCGHEVREGPASVLDRLTDEQLKELI